MKNFLIIITIIVTIKSSFAQMINEADIDKYSYNPTLYSNQEGKNINSNYASINSNSDSIETQKPKPKFKFNDGMGEGYRVYDNSNRQSYFCSLNSKNSKKFTHQNNFSGIYFGLGANFVGTSLDITQSQGSQATTQNGSITYNATSNSVAPAIIIGQGRLFSNGLFLGQEMSIIVGDIELSKNDLKASSQNPNSATIALVDSVKFRASNMSFYSGKFGYNFYNSVLAYLKLGISFSSTNYSLKFKNGITTNFSGDFPFMVFGAGLDISLFEHYRLMLDYSAIFNSGEVKYYEYTAGKTTPNLYNIPVDTTISMTRANLVYRF